MSRGVRVWTAVGEAGVLAPERGLGTGVRDPSLGPASHRQPDRSAVCSMRTCRIAGTASRAEVAPYNAPCLHDALPLPHSTTRPVPSPDSMRPSVCAAWIRLQSPVPAACDAFPEVYMCERIPILTAEAPTSCQTSSRMGLEPSCRAAVFRRRLPYLLGFLEHAQLPTPGNSSSHRVCPA